ncbi:gamma-butyrobetaine dioxygenase-like [Penaeus japonicus]|uniref:gamma-butyrobetaine dioxygenase-like n=1 Tax=Penaeus japonicus TaxID=27405 RepID=UPI001C71776F|nr:gamma-butyrobetaine dioxygenase-like [Penaeus japonicus]
MQAGCHALFRRGGSLMRHSAKLMLPSARAGTTSLSARQRAPSATPALCDQYFKRDVSTSVTSDLHRPQPGLVSASQGHNTLKVFWREGEPEEFPYVWLKDNCQCPACFLSTASSRVARVSNLSLDVRPKDVHVSPDGESLTVVWEDGHEGTFEAGWLHERAFNPTQQDLHQNFYKLRPELWNSDMSQRIPRASFDELMEDDAALLKMLECMEVLGLTVVSGARLQEGELHRLSERVSYLVPTHYGTTFTVKNKADPSNPAYTGKFLDLHCDLAFLHYKPCVQLLHCVTQFSGDGGDSILADSHYVAAKMRELYPEKFHLLAEILVDFRDAATDEGLQFDIIARRPMISLKPTGEIDTVNISTTGRDSHLGVTPEEAVSWYDAYLTYCDLLYSPENHFTYKLESGEILIVDNHRILHGRTAYQAYAGERHVQGGYWDWDMMRSRRRVLQRKLKGSS